MVDVDTCKKTGEKGLQSLVKRFMNALFVGTIEYLLTNRLARPRQPAEPNHSIPIQGLRAFSPVRQGEPHSVPGRQ